MPELALIIEDDLDLSTIFSEALTAAGFKTEALLDGKAAQVRLNEVVPYIVILDMHLPYVSGLDLLQQIRTDERLKQALVVICTADARMGEAVTDDADFVLIKPITFTQLRDLTRRLK
ncbi:MAG: response regulator [Chloroflexota bacterium]